MILLDGKALSQIIKQNLKKESQILKQKGVEPCLAVILVGDDQASKLYVSAKEKACLECDIKSLIYKLDNNTTQNELLALINALNYDDTVDGILVQLPLKNINKNIVLQSIKSSKDVDGFHPLNVGLLNSCLNGFLPCTPYGIIRLLEYYNIKLEGLNAVIINASNIVGRPLASMLLNKNSTVTVCHIKTQNLSLHTKNADLLISATGKPKLITQDLVKENAIVVDVGITHLENQIVGDVDFEQVSKKASFITPVPGGVGPMTIAMLLENTIKAAKNRLKI